MTIYDSTYFRIETESCRNAILLKQYIKGPVINTCQLPGTSRYLKSFIPTIFDNLCFNDLHQPFAQEAKHTEVGHLFEHLLLEYLKLEAEHRKIRTEFNGETSWDWSKYGKGTFLIRLSMNKQCLPFFARAFSKATLTLDMLYASESKVGEAINPTYLHV